MNFRKIAVLPTASVLASALLSISFDHPAVAQDSSTAGPGAGTPPALDVPRGNPLEGLFTPQPQYVTPQTLVNPQPLPPAAGDLNPLKGLFTPQPQFQTPQTLSNPNPAPLIGEPNHLKSVFTPPNQFATPQTLLNPDPVPRAFVPERQLLWGTAAERDALIKHHNLRNFGVEDPERKLQLQQQQALQQRHHPNQTSTRQNSTSQAASDRAEEEISDIRQALNMVHKGKLNESLKILDHTISKFPKDAQAYYLKATILVQMRRYPEATSAYRAVLQYSQSDQLSSLAKIGLTKLAR